jgi:alkylhydroperoxidase family enzyme
LVSRLETSLGEPLDYLRAIVRASLAAFFAFRRLVSPSQFRRALPLEELHVVRIVTAAHEECGACVQTTLTMAARDGVPPRILRAIVDERLGELGTELADVHQLVRATLSRAGEDVLAPLRERIRARHGPDGDAVLVEIALVLSATRAFPVTKRLLGYATTCARLSFEVPRNA